MSEPTGYRKTTRAGKWEDITELLTPEAVEQLRAGATILLPLGDSEPTPLERGLVLRFRKPLTERLTSLKVMRLDREKGKLWAKEVDLIDGDEAEQIMEDEMNSVGTNNRHQRRWMARKKK